MIKKPEKCCPCGSYECTIPMTVKNKVVWVDYCIADIVAGINAVGSIKTSASCCGHGVQDGNIILEDGRWITIEKKVWKDGEWKKE